MLRVNRPSRDAGLFFIYLQSIWKPLIYSKAKNKSAKRLDHP
jgi:hypothetical protein